MLTICVNCGLFGSLPEPERPRSWPVRVTCIRCPDVVEIVD